MTLAKYTLEREDNGQWHVRLWAGDLRLFSGTLAECAEYLKNKNLPQPGEILNGLTENSAGWFSEGFPVSPRWPMGISGLLANTKSPIKVTVGGYSGGDIYPAKVEVLCPSGILTWTAKEED